MFVDGRVVVIVGAGPGLGATLARRCAADGADVVVAARTLPAIEKIAAEVRSLGARAAAPTDVVERDQVEALALAAYDEFGRIDVLVNAAFPPSPGGNVVDMDDATLAAWRASVDAVTGPS